MAELKAAWEIALEKHEDHERLAVVTDELLEHVRLLEEGWNSIRPRTSDAPAGAPGDVLPLRRRNLPRAA